MKIAFLKTIIFLTLQILLNAQNSVPPTWIPNNYFQAVAVGIKTNLATTFNSTNPITKTIPFTKAYTSVPKLAYGIKNYRGNDKLLQQNFAINNTGMTNTQFTVYTMIDGVTNIRIFTIIYLAVDPSYPYHLNTFNNIEANYSTGLGITNITSGTGTQSYINTINYTQLATSIASPFTSFGLNLSKDLVALYLSAIYNSGSNGKSIHWTATSPVIDTTHFQININVLDGYSILLLRFSIVAMDIAEVQKSGQFTIEYKSLTFSATVTNYISMPSAFSSASFIGLLDYSANSGGCGLQFNWQYDLPNNRIVINQSIPYSSSSATCGLLSYRVIIFYVKTWFCPSPYYYFNLATNLCDNYCQAYYYGNISAAACQPCQFGCYGCVDLNNSSISCVACNPADFRQLVNGTCVCLIGYSQANVGNSTVCVSCGGVTPNCGTCVNDTACLSCLPGFILQNQNCISCSLPYCTLCDAVNNSMTCLACNSTANYFLNLGLCQLCNISECLTCADLTTCQQCNTINNYFLNITTGLCDICILTDCLVCSSLYDCVLCNFTDNFFLNATTGQCQTCTLLECLQCTSLTTCVLCNATANYFINISTFQCSYCNNTQNYFIDPNTLNCDLCSLSNCINCMSLLYCSVCDQNNSYFLNLTDYHCYPCNLIGCDTCQTLYTCSVCNNSDYFLNTTDNQCYQCNLAGCVTCATLYTCAVCNISDNWGLTSGGICLQCPFTCLCDGYVLPKTIDPLTNVSVCSTVCGDGLIRLNEQCDDGNTIDNDGCSSTCKIQHLWTCATSNTSAFSCCTLQNSLFSLNLISTIKPANQNAIIIQLQLVPMVSFFQQQNLASISTVTITGIPLYNQIKISSGQNLTLKYNYNQSIQGKKGYVEVQLTASNSNQPNSTCAVVVNQTIEIQPRSSNNLPFMYYSQDDYNSINSMDNAVNYAQIISYVLLILSAIPCKIVGLQLFGVLQLAYFVLAQCNFVNALLTPYMKMSSVNGLNLQLSQQSSLTPDRVSSLGYRALFLNNCNVMFLLMLSEILVGLGLYAATKLLKNISEKFNTIAKYMLKEVLITLLLFNAFNLSFGVGIHFTYADKNEPLYDLSTFCAITAIVLPIFTMIGLMMTDAKQFGEFRNKFKPDFLCQMYFVFTIIYRFALGYYIATMNSYSLSTLIVISFSFMFLLYNLVNLPFIDAYQNYRANVCHVTQLIILLVTNYYESMKSTTPLQQKAYYYNAAYLQIAAIYTCIAVSGICLGVQIYKFVKALFSPQSSKVSNHMYVDKMQTIIEQKHHTQQNLEQNNRNQSFSDLFFQ